MATYKVIQDIEADDKLVGPLTLRQFIYAAIVVVSGFIAFKLAAVSIFFIIPFIPIILFFGLLAAPFGREQSNEIWLLARIKFFFKPRVRKWNQTGVNNLVTITIPKKVERRLTKGFSQDEAKSRLQALANTIDTRGWAVKNVNVNLFSKPSLIDQGTSERLIDPSTLPKEVPGVDITAQDDIFETSNIKAQNINKILASNEQAHKKYQRELVTNAPPKPNQVTPDYWFMNNAAGESAPTEPGMETFQDTKIVAPGSVDDHFDPLESLDEKKLESSITDTLKHTKQKARSYTNGHMRVVEPLSSKKSVPVPPPQTPVTSQPVNAKLNLLASDNNRSVASLAHEANEEVRKQEPPDEVVISLH